MRQVFWFSTCTNDFFLKTKFLKIFVSQRRKMKDERGKRGNERRKMKKERKVISPQLAVYKLRIGNRQ